MKPSTHNKLRTRRSAPRATLALLLAAAMLPVVFFSGSDGIIAAPDGFSGSISGYIRTDDDNNDEKYAEPVNETGEDPEEAPVEDMPDTDEPAGEPGEAAEDAEPSNGPAYAEPDESPEDGTELPEAPEEDIEPAEAPEEEAAPDETPEDSEPAEGPAPGVPEEVQADAETTEKPPLPGYTVYLYRADDLTKPTATAVTGADGKYTFTELEPGTYRVGIPLLADGGTLYQLADGGAGGFEAGAPVAFSRALELTEGAMELEDVSALLKVSPEQPLPEEEEEEEEMMTLSATAPIDLSHNYGGTGSGTGYTITGASPYQALTVTSDAGGPYTIIQSDYDSCLFRNIAVNNGVTTQITIVGINMKTPDNAQGTPPFALQGTANVELFIENAADGSHNKLEHSYTDSSSANNAALYVPTGATLTIDGSGKLEATGGRSGAGIGGGTTSVANASAGTITIKGGAVEAYGGFYAAGIGGSDSGKSGKITIEGGTVTATGGFHGAGIGFGSSGGAIYPGNDNDSFNSITITDGHVEATGGQYSAGIGGGYSCAGGRTTITGGVIVATGGDGSAGAGIGGGYSGRGGFITISGDADITATGGSSGLDGSYEAPGIGGAGDGANNTYLTLDHTATVKAYAASPLASISRPAIYTGEDAISGTGYFVNAYFFADILPSGGGIRLDVYANGGSVKTNTLTLPARVNSNSTTYRGFAYTTGAQAPQNDRILAYAADGASLGSVVLNDNSSPDIESFNDRSLLRVKLGGPIAGTLTVDEIGYNSAKLTSTGHNLGGCTFTSGGFRYSAKPDMTDAVDVPWTAGAFTSSPVSKTVSNLTPDTVYYAQAYLSTNFAGGTVYSSVVPFKTLARPVIDLSKTKENGTGYTVSGSPPKQTLTINSSAGSPYTIIQSGGNDPGTSIFQNIVVAGGITVTITIREINVLCETANTPVFSVRSSSSAQTSVTLLLDGENTLTQSATGAGNNAALSVSRPNELNFNYTAILAVNTVPEGGGSLTATGGAGGAGIGGGDSGRNGQININGGTITAEGGAGTDGGAGIGSNGGYLNGDNHITVSGGIVSATGGAGSVNGGAGIGAGGNGNVAQGSAGINGTAKVVATGGTGVSGGAGIGSGGSSRAGGGSAGSLGVSGSAKVTALGGAGTSYGGAGFGAGGNGGGGSNIQTYGSAELTAKGGAGINGGAGVGGGGTDPAYPYIGAGGSVYITGTAKVVATGGIGSSSSGAGIGGGGGSGAGISGDGRASLSLASTATVKAYSHSADHPAIQASYNFGGNGYYVNAYFGEGEEPSVLTGDATRLKVYAGNDLVTEANTLELPDTYRGFAYTTNNTAEQSDVIRADIVNGTPIGLVTLYDTGSPLIGSVKNPGTLLRVKLSSEAGAPSVTNIQKDATGVTSRADFTSTGHSLLYGATLDEGGFRYSKSRNSETGALTGSVDTKAWAEQTAASPKTETVASLEPNTRYYMATYLNTTIVNGAQNLTSGSVQFATLPYIESASASAAPGDNTAALISAEFYVSTATNIATDSVTLYWDTAPIDAGSPETAARSETLAPATYSDAGFTDHRLEGLIAETVYNLLLVIENESGTDSFAFEYVPSFEIDVSVPVKLIFAAFDTDAGAVTSPVYFIKNNGSEALDVTVGGFDEISGAGLTLTQGAPSAGEICLKLKGAGASLGTGMAGYLVDSDSIDEPLCTLQGSGSAGDTYYFTLDGEYNGEFDTVKRPEYFLDLKFALAAP